MFDHIDHIAIAVEDVEASVTLYRDVFGLTVTHEETVMSQGTHAVFLSSRSGPDIELLGSLGPQTPVGKFLATRGAGMHHICYAVPDIDAAIAECQAQGLRMIDDHPHLGAKGKLLAFIHPKSTGRVLIELYQA